MLCLVNGINLFTKWFFSGTGFLTTDSKKISIEPTAFKALHYVSCTVCMWT